MRKNTGRPLCVVPDPRNDDARSWMRFGSQNGQHRVQMRAEQAAHDFGGAVTLESDGATDSDHEILRRGR
jgi:hypothetical protein